MTGTNKRSIQPMPAERIAELKATIERRWDEKPWYQGDDEPGSLSSPGCTMRAHEILTLIAAAEAGSEAVLQQGQTTFTVAEFDEGCELAKQEGYEEAVQEIDELTGGDGEYRVSLDLGGGVNEERHTPDAPSMIARIVDRFQSIDLMKQLLLGQVVHLERAQKNAARLLKLMEDAPTDRHSLTYTNYRGETSLRNLHPVRMWWGGTEWHPEPQLLLTAFDHDKNAYRDFAVADFDLGKDDAAPTISEEKKGDRDAPWIVSKERDLLRLAIVRYGDRSRMGAVEPRELQQVIDDAFETLPHEAARLTSTRRGIEGNSLSYESPLDDVVEEDVVGRQPETPWKWYAGENDETFSVGPFDSREAVLNEAKGQRLGESQDENGAFTLTFHVVEARTDPLRLADFVDAETFLDDAETSLENDNRLMDEEEGPFFNCSPEEQLDLELRLKSCCDRWQAVHGLRFPVKSFSHTRNGQRVVIGADEGRPV